jgi:streptogramin lyase
LLYRLLTLFLVTAAGAVPSAAAAPSPELLQPFDVLPLANGHLIVSDLALSRVLDVDPARGSARVVGNVGEARELERLPDGRVLVSSRERVWALDLRTHRKTLYATFKNYLLGIALAPDGWLYGSENVTGSEQTTIARMRGRTREVVVPTLHGVHEMLWTRAGLILCEAYGGRLLRLDPQTKQVTVLATGMKNPSSAVEAAAGGWFVSEFFGNRISHVWPDGHVTKVADVFKPGPLAFDSLHRIVGASMDDGVFRVVRGRAITIYP